MAELVLMRQCAMPLARAEEYAALCFCAWHRLLVVSPLSRHQRAVAPYRAAGTRHNSAVSVTLGSVQALADAVTATPLALDAALAKPLPDVTDPPCCVSGVSFSSGVWARIQPHVRALYLAWGSKPPCLSVHDRFVHPLDVAPDVIAAATVLHLLLRSRPAVAVVTKAVHAAASAISPTPAATVASLITAVSAVSAALARGPHSAGKAEVAIFRSVGLRVRAAPALGRPGLKRRAARAVLADGLVAAFQELDFDAVLEAAGLSLGQLREAAGRQGEAWSQQDFVTSWGRVVAGVAAILFYSVEVSGRHATLAAISEPSMTATLSSRVPSTASLTEYI
jgi:hypothetical protein